MKEINLESLESKDNNSGSGNLDNMDLFKGINLNSFDGNYTNYITNENEQFNGNLDINMESYENPYVIDNNQEVKVAPKLNRKLRSPNKIPIKKKKSKEDKEETNSLKAKRKTCAKKFKEDEVK